MAFLVHFGPILGPKKFSPENLALLHTIFFSIWVFFHEHSQITRLQGKAEKLWALFIYAQIFRLLTHNLTWVFSTMSKIKEN